MPQASSAGESLTHIATAFLDSSFIADLLFEDAKFYDSANRLMRRFEASRRQADIRLCVSTRVVDEVLWIARVFLFDGDHGPGSWAALSPRGREEAWISYSEEIADLGRVLLSPDAPWEVLSVTIDDLGLAVSAMQSHSLQPADASHYAVACRNCNGCIVTNDRHFRQISELDVIRYDAGD
ncbi:MAG: type II toxin-antitoxin system VapC family toxin [Armatimonadota bacterium]